MMRGIPVKLPVRMYSFLKDRAIRKETNLKVEAGRMFDKYLEFEAMEEKLKGKKVLVFK